MEKTLKKLHNLAKGLNVLYVEDEESLRTSFSRYLGNFFDSVTSCENGLIGLEEYKEEKYDLVITDIYMPELDGLEMSAKIKELNNEQKILVVSACGDVPNFMQSIKLGIDGFIVKPIDYEQLNEALLKCVEQINLINTNNSYKESLENVLEEKIYELHAQYITDHLTKLPNMVSLKEKLDKEKIQTLILFDTNNFKLVNLNFGMSIGDRVLENIANILKKFENKDFTLYRLIGDTFAFFCEGEKEEKALELVKEIRSYFEQNILKVDSLELHISFTIAIDYGKKDLIKNTSLAISKLKELGSNKLSVHEVFEEFENQQRENLNSIKKLSLSMKKDQLVPYFQEIYNVKEKTHKKYEVLARVVRDDEIMVPAQFIKAAYLGGLGIKMTKILIDKALEKIQNTDIQLSFNITQDDLDEKYLLEYFEQTRKKYNIKSSQIILEIVESVNTESFINTLEQIKTFKKAGYKISVDDFGVEMSNYSRLIALEVDYIKIDGSFIKDIDSCKNSKLIVESIIDFSHKIGMSVVAEYVHNEAVFNTIKDLDIDFVQGYYIDKPKALIGS